MEKAVNAELPLSINIDSEAINRMVSEAILKSTLGDAIKEAIKRETAKLTLTSSYNNPLDQVIRQHVANIAHEILRAEWRDVINTAVGTALKEAITTEAIHRMAQSMVASWERAANQ